MKASLLFLIVVVLFFPVYSLHALTFARRLHVSWKSCNFHNNIHNKRFLHERNIIQRKSSSASPINYEDKKMNCYVGVRLCINRRDVQISTPPPPQCPSLCVSILRKMYYTQRIVICMNRTAQNSLRHFRLIYVGLYIYATTLSSSD